MRTKEAICAALTDPIALAPPVAVSGGMFPDAEAPGDCPPGAMPKLPSTPSIRKVFDDGLCPLTEIFARVEESELVGPGATVPGASVNRLCRSLL